MNTQLLASIGVGALSMGFLLAVWRWSVNRHQAAEAARTARVLGGHKTPSRSAWPNY